MDLKAYLYALWTTALIVGALCWVLTNAERSMREQEIVKRATCEMKELVNDHYYHFIEGLKREREKQFTQKIKENMKELVSNHYHKRLKREVIHE